MSRSNDYRWMTEDKPARFINGRRPWTRKAKYPAYLRRYCHPPPRWWWQEEHAKARRVQKQEFERNSDDPVISPMNRIVNLYAWY